MHPVNVSNTIGSNPARTICFLLVVPLGHVADIRGLHLDALVQIATFELSVDSEIAKQRATTL